GIARRSDLDPPQVVADFPDQAAGARGVFAFHRQLQLGAQLGCRRHPEARALALERMPEPFDRIEVAALQRAKDLAALLPPLSEEAQRQVVDVGLYLDSGGAGGLCGRLLRAGDL